MYSAEVYAAVFDAVATARKWVAMVAKDQIDANRATPTMSSVCAEAALGVVAVW